MRQNTFLDDYESCHGFEYALVITLEILNVTLASIRLGKKLPGESDATPSGIIVGSVATVVAKSLRVKTNNNRFIAKFV